VLRELLSSARSDYFALGRRFEKNMNELTQRDPITVPPSEAVKSVTFAEINRQA
jgi:hypothetical protein